jgi:hypothetical protein
LVEIASAAASGRAVAVADGRWMADTLAAYVGADADGCTLDDVFGFGAIQGKRSWRQVRNVAMRDEAIRDLAREKFAGICPAAAAREISRLLSRYETTQWRVDRDQPAEFARQLTSPRAHLFRALKSGAAMPGFRRLQDILSGGIMQ